MREYISIVETRLDKAASLLREYLRLVEEREYYVLRPTDVGRSIIRCFGKPWMVSNFMGRILSGDVGKRVYLIKGNLQVENDQQRDQRWRDEMMRPFRPAEPPTNVVPFRRPR